MLPPYFRFIRNCLHICTCHLYVPVLAWKHSSDRSNKRLMYPTVQQKQRIRHVMHEKWTNDAIDTRCTHECNTNVNSMLDANKNTKYIWIRCTQTWKYTEHDEFHAWCNQSATKIRIWCLMLQYSGSTKDLLLEPRSYSTSIFLEISSRPPFQNRMITWSATHAINKNLSHHLERATLCDPNVRM
jgi:hypothetical protein